MVNRNRVKSTPIKLKIGFTARVEPKNGSCRHCYTMAGGPLPLISLKYRRNCSGGALQDSDASNDGCCIIKLQVSFSAML